MINVGCRAYLELERGLQLQYFSEASTQNVLKTWMEGIVLALAEIESGMEGGLSTGQWQLLIYGKGNRQRLEISGNRFCSKLEPPMLANSPIQCILYMSFNAA